MHSNTVYLYNFFLFYTQIHVYINISVWQSKQRSCMMIFIQRTEEYNTGGCHWWLCERQTTKSSNCRCFVLFEVYTRNLKGNKVDRYFNSTFWCRNMHDALSLIYTPFLVTVLH
jgi:hypothetical protein